MYLYVYIHIYIFVRTNDNLDFFKGIYSCVTGYLEYPGKEGN